MKKFEHDWWAALKNGELMQLAAEWISDSVSAHYEFGNDVPSENDGKRLCGELHKRAEKARLMGNGEGNTTLILTDAESRLIRELLAPDDDILHAEGNGRGLAAFNRGIQRGTDRIKAEFDAEQKARKK